MRYFFVAAFSFFLSMSAYGEHHEAHHRHDPADHQQAIEHELVLNDGKKWPMDEHTRSMFEVMVARVEGGGDIKKLGQQLQNDLDKLIQGCTMTGAAHDELHEFLMVYIPAVHETAEKGTELELSRVKALLAEYPKFFE